MQQTSQTNLKRSPAAGSSRATSKEAKTPPQGKASSLRQQKQNSSKQSAKNKAARRSFKQSLESPYTVSWPPLSDHASSTVLGVLARDVGALLKALQPETKEAGGAKQAATQSPSSLGVLLGFNAVTRAAEHGTVAIVIAAQQNINPAAVLDHLIMLSHIKQFYLCLLPVSSGSLGETLGLRSCLALGLRETTELKDTIATLKPHGSIVSLPWLQRVTEESTAAAVADSHASEADAADSNVAVKSATQGKPKRAKTNDALKAIHKPANIVSLAPKREPKNESK